MLAFTFILALWIPETYSFCSSALIYYSQNIPNGKTMSVFGKFSLESLSFQLLMKKKRKKMLKVLRKVQSLHLVSTISTCATLHVCESDPGNLWTGCNQPPICWETLQEWLQLPKIIMSLTSSSSYAWGRSHTCASLLASGKQARKRATPTVPSRNHPHQNGEQWFIPRVLAVLRKIRIHKNPNGKWLWTKALFWQQFCAVTFPL